MATAVFYSGVLKALSTEASKADGDGGWRRNVGST